MKNRKRNRLNGYDYSDAGCYFVTFCIQDRTPLFGKIEEDKLIQNDFGRLMSKTITWLEEQYSYLEIHQYVVMPDHVHLLLEINRSNDIRNKETYIDEMETDRTVGTGRDLSLQHTPSKVKSLSELIGALKTVSSKQIRMNGYPEFAWQRSFHDQIIRSKVHFCTIEQYIIDNPKRCSDRLRPFNTP